jgi:tripeptidyl-peptidase-1
LCGRGGRGYPDVSAVGDNIVIFLEGIPSTIDGTSVFRAIFNIINEERIAAGESTVKFVNPTLVCVWLSLLGGRMYG